MNMINTVDKVIGFEIKELRSMDKGSEASVLNKLRIKAEMALDKMFASDDDTEQLTDADSTIIASLLAKHASRLSDSK